MKYPSKRSLDSNTQTRVLRLRIKDKNANWLDALSREVNYVWNFCNEHSMKVLKRERRFVSGFDLHVYTKGAVAAGREHTRHGTRESEYFRSRGGEGL